MKSLYFLPSQKMVHKFKELMVWFLQPFSQLEACYACLVLAQNCSGENPFG